MFRDWCCFSSLCWFWFARKCPADERTARRRTRARRRERHCCRCCCTLVVSLGIFVLIYWAIFQPHQIRASVDYAELSNLTVSNASSSSAAVAVSYHVAANLSQYNPSKRVTIAVSYHVVMNLSLYNPSKRVNIYYDTLDAELRYRGAVLSPAAASPAEFYQRRKAAQAARFAFEGKGVVVPGDDVGKQLERDVKAGVKLDLELHIDARLRYVFGRIKIRQKPTVWCALGIPVPSTPGGTSVISSGDRCSVKYR